MASLTPDKNSRLVYAGFANNTDLSLGYDTRGREDYRSYGTPMADPFFRADLGYDPQSNITSRSTSFNGTVLSESFAYDHQDRLTSHTRGAEPDVTWQYDKMGNWDATNQNGAPEVRTVNADNEYTAVNGLTPAHDLRGNMTFDGSQTYVYDWANRLVKVKSGAQTLAEYTYDALNRRVTKTVGTATTTYVYDDADVIEEYEAGALSRAFVYGAFTDEPILMEIGGQTYYYATDHLGSIRAVTDSTGALVESYEYSPFGLMTVFDSSGQNITGSTIGNPYGYTGRRWDTESGLWYYRNRMYSTALGRFLQRDPAGYVDGLNLYAYVFNNPLRYTDPDGMMARAAYHWTSTNVIDPASAFISEGINYYDNKWNQGYTDKNSIIYTSENLIKNTAETSLLFGVEVVRTFTSKPFVNIAERTSVAIDSWNKDKSLLKQTVNVGVLLANTRLEFIENNLLYGEVGAEIFENAITANSKNSVLKSSLSQDLRGARIGLNGFQTQLLESTNTNLMGKGYKVPFLTDLRREISDSSVANRTQISKLSGEITKNTLTFGNRWQQLVEK